MYQAIQAFVAHHGIAVSLSVFWPILSGVLNVMLSLWPPADWIAFAERRPKLAACFKLLRAAGLDPERLLRALLELIVRKPIPAKAGDQSGRITLPDRGTGPTP